MKLCGEEYARFNALREFSRNTDGVTSVSIFQPGKFSEISLEIQMKFTGIPLQILFGRWQSINIVVFMDKRVDIYGLRLNSKILKLSLNEWGIVSRHNHSEIIKSGSLLSVVQAYYWETVHNFLDNHIETYSINPNNLNQNEIHEEFTIERIFLE